MRPIHIPSRLAALAALTATLAVPAATATAAPPSFYPSGPVVGVPTSQLQGWTLCYSGAYNATTSLSAVLSGCPGTYLLMASRQLGSATLDVAAAAPRADVLYDTGSRTNTTHNANGTAWYYSATWSWGFAKQGDAVDRDRCDIATTDAQFRLCWHTDMGNLIGGYRSGAVTDLNYSTTFERLIFRPSGTGTTTGSTGTGTTTGSTGTTTGTGTGSTGTTTGTGSTGTTTGSTGTSGTGGSTGTTTGSTGTWNPTAGSGAVAPIRCAKARVVGRVARVTCRLVKPISRRARFALRSGSRSVTGVRRGRAVAFRWRRALRGKFVVTVTTGSGTKRRTVRYPVRVR